MIVLLGLGVFAACGGTLESAPTRCTTQALSGTWDFAHWVGTDACPEPDLGTPQGWRHGFKSFLATLAGAPVHSANDPVVNPGQGAVLWGKFAYGLVSKDLEDEWVATLIRPPECGPWEFLGWGRTDGEGWIGLSIDGSYLPEPGIYDFRLVAVGDMSVATGAIWVVEPGTQAVVFDIDSTLTSSDSEVFGQILFGFEPEMLPAADQLTGLYAAAGYLPLYLTGRPNQLADSSRWWLLSNGFPVGPLRTTDSLLQSLPSDVLVGEYKRTTLVGLEEEQGIDFPSAYGNATTDICAYAEAGINPASTFITGTHGGEACAGYAATRAVADYPSHIQQDLATLPPAP